MELKDRLTLSKSVTRRRLELAGLIDKKGHPVQYQDKQFAKFNAILRAAARYRSSISNRNIDPLIYGNKK